MAHQLRIIRDLHYIIDAFLYVVLPFYSALPELCVLPSPNRFFGGGFGGFGFGGGEPETPRGESIYVELEVTLRDLFLGSHVRVSRDKNVIKPAPGKRECNCRNRVVTQQLGPGMFQQYTQRECEQCDNVKYERQTDVVTVSVEPGMVDGHDITFFEEGEPLIDGEPGDLIFRIRTLPHPLFTRQGADLHMKQTISLVDALVGFKMEIEHLDGKKVELANAGVTRPGQVQRLPGQGMPVFEKEIRGDLYVQYTVAFPKDVSDAQKKQLKDIFSKAEWAHDEL